MSTLARRTGGVKPPPHTQDELPFVPPLPPRVVADRGLPWAHQPCSLYAAPSARAALAVR